MVRSNVRGPSVSHSRYRHGTITHGSQSALSEFLRSRGIRIENTSARNRRTDAVASQAETTLAASEEATPDDTTAAVDQEQLDALVAEELTVALETERPKRRARAGTTKKRKKGEEDEAYDPENEPDYGRSGFTRKNRPINGQIDFCASCNCRFTVTVYNKTSDDGGLLCSACGSRTKDASVRSTPKIKPTTKKRRAKAVLDGDIDKVPKLQDMAIKCIARHIEEVELLGDIGHVNMDKICQIISRNRSLTNETIQLFLDASLKTLSLYDCAKINQQRLTQIAQMCPHLIELRLQMVGQITDSVLHFYAKHLKNLKSLALRGCFLITTQGWVQFFEMMGPRLESIEISDTSRFDASTAQKLVQLCPNITHLTLSRITHLGDDTINELAHLVKLQELDISHAGSPVTDVTMIPLLTSIGVNLKSLNITALKELTDSTFQTGLMQCCHNLQHLVMNDLDLVTDDGLTEVFSTWENPPLLSLEVERCTLLKDKSIGAALSHSGSNLRRLNLNSLDEMTHDGILQISKSGALPQCELLDISWIRAVDDQVLSRLLENAKQLKKLLIWGNNRVTDAVVSESCLIVGREST